jgi:hypothetical protein
MYLKDEFRDFAADVKVNKFKLENDCETHASLYHYWADLLAKAKKQRDKADEIAKATRSRRELEIRAAIEKGDKSYDKYGKVTEGVIKSLLDTDEEVMEAAEAKRKADGVVYDLEAAVRSLEHRRDELDNLTKLWLGGYYAKPNSDAGRRDSPDDNYSNELRGNLNKKRTKGE